MDGAEQNHGNPSSGETEKLKTERNGKPWEGFREGMSSRIR
jgi:hypothetical protein